MRFVSVRAPLAVCLAGASIGLAACDRSPVEPAAGLSIREIILAGDDGSFVFSHADHWHGAPVVHLDESAGFTVYFSAVSMPPDEHDAPPAEQWFTLQDHPGHDVRVIIEDTTLARWDGDRVRGTLRGLRTGASRMSFVVRAGTTTLYEAPPLNFRVQAPPD